MLHLWLPALARMAPCIQWIWTEAKVRGLWSQGSALPLLSQRASEGSASQQGDQAQTPSLCTEKGYGALRTYQRRVYQAFRKKLSLRSNENEKYIA